MQPQPDRLHPLRDRRQHRSCLAFADAVHHRVIHIPLERDARKFPGQPRIERIMEEQISQHRRHRRPLRGPPVSFQHAPVGILYRRLEPPCHIQDHPRQVGIGLHRLDDEVTRDGVEELLDVKINHPVALPAPPLAHLNRILRRSPRPSPPVSALPPSGPPDRTRKALLTFECPRHAASVFLPPAPVAGSSSPTTSCSRSCTDCSSDRLRSPRWNTRPPPVHPYCP